MKHFQHLTLLITLAFSFFILHSISFAQVETLSDEEYRQEVQTHMTVPCFEKAGRFVIQEMNLEEEQLTGVEFLRILNADHIDEIENKLIDQIMDNIKGKPKSERMIWYKIGDRICVNAWKEEILKDGILSKLMQSTKSLKEPVKQPDYPINKKQPNSDKSISDQAKEQALKTCNESMQLIGGEVSYRMLNACVEQELQAYQEFQRNYGN